MHLLRQDCVACRSMESFHSPLKCSNEPDSRSPAGYISAAQTEKRGAENNVWLCTFPIVMRSYAVLLVCREKSDPQTTSMLLTGLLFSANFISVDFKDRLKANGILPNVINWFTCWRRECCAEHSFSCEKIAFRWLLNEVLFRHRCRVLECTGSMPLSSSKWGNKILVFSKILLKSSYQFSIFHVREPLKTNQIWSQYFSRLYVTSKCNKVQNMQCSCVTCLK